MTILLIITTLGFLIFAKVTTQSLSKEKLKAGFLMRCYEDSTQQNLQYYSDSWILQEYSLERKVQPYQNIPGFLEIDYTVQNDLGVVITSAQRIVRDFVYEKN